MALTLTHRSSTLKYLTAACIPLRRRSLLTNIPFTGYVEPIPTGLMTLPLMPGRKMAAFDGGFYGGNRIIDAQMTFGGAKRSLIMVQRQFSTGPPEDGRNKFFEKFFTWLGSKLKHLGIGFFEKVLRFLSWLGSKLKTLVDLIVGFFVSSEVAAAITIGIIGVHELLKFAKESLWSLFGQEIEGEKVHIDEKEVSEVVERVLKQNIVTLLEQMKEKLDKMSDLQAKKTLLASEIDALQEDTLRSLKTSATSADVKAIVSGFEKVKKFVLTL